MISLKHLFFLLSVITLVSYNALAGAAEVNPNHGSTVNPGLHQQAPSQLNTHLKVPTDDKRKESPFLQDEVQHPVEHPPQQPSSQHDAHSNHGHSEKASIQHIAREISEREIPHLAARDPNFRSFVRGVGGVLGEMMKRAETHEPPAAEPAKSLGEHRAVFQRAEEHHIYHLDEQADGQTVNQMSGGPKQVPPPVPPKPVLPPSREQHIIHHADEDHNNPKLNQFSGTSKPLPPPQIPPATGNPPSYRNTFSNPRRRAVEGMLSSPPPHIRASRRVQRRSTIFSGSDGASSAGASVAGAPGRDTSSRGASVSSQVRISSDPSGKSATISRKTETSDDSNDLSDSYKKRYQDLLQQMKAIRKQQQLQRQNQNQRHTYSQYSAFPSQDDDFSGHGGFSRYGSMELLSEPHEMNHFASPQNFKRLVARSQAAYASQQWAHQGQQQKRESQGR